MFFFIPILMKTCFSVSLYHSGLNPILSRGKQIGWWEEWTEPRSSHDNFDLLTAPQQLRTFTSIHVPEDTANTAAEFFFNTATIFKYTHTQSFILPGQVCALHTLMMLYLAAACLDSWYIPAIDPVMA